MAIQRYKISLNNARFPLVSKWANRASLISSLDVIGRRADSAVGDDENIDLNVPQILYGENFVPVAGGVKSASYKQVIAPTVNTDFDQIFPLRDSEENTVLFSPGGGKNYVYDAVTELWTDDPLPAKWLAEAPSLYLANTSQKTPATAKVTRAYVDGKTVVCYSRLGLTTNASGTGLNREGSLYAWSEFTNSLARVSPQDASGTYKNLTIPLGEIDGVSSSNGYLIIWSGLEVHWAPFNGTAFDFDLYANGEVTGAGHQIPEDIQGPITAITPMSGGYIIWTTKNAIAAFYNANNFASPWIFKNISGAGGLESFEQSSSEGGVGSAYAYTTGGMQKVSLNTAETVFPDVGDFLNAKYIEHFNTGNLTFDPGTVPIALYVKLFYCGQRFLVISYGTYPGIFSYALIYDAGLKRWGKLRIVHRDCFSYQFGTLTEDVTYSMLNDVSYDELDVPYEDATVESPPLVYPRQSVAFLLASGEVKLAVLDYSVPEDDSEAFVAVGRNQLSRANLVSLLSVEMDGLAAGGTVAVWPSKNGRTLEAVELGVLREQTEDYAEYGFDMPTGKNFTIYVKGQFALTDMIVDAMTDGKI